MLRDRTYDTCRFLESILTIAELKMMAPKYQANGNGMGMAGNGNGNGDGNGMAMETEWEDWRQGECLLPQLVGNCYDQQQWCDVRFCLADGSVVAAHKLVQILHQLGVTHSCLSQVVET